ncbi:MAG: 3'-5' exonuclease [Anaerolineaceae bacterium]|nr:3'-5' exonuclease [Anaerolineaceae bacterium]
MPYIITVKPAFRADFLNLNKDMQRRVDAAQEELELDPITPRGDTIKRLKHHEHLWRYRIGEYRMVYAVFPGRDLVQILGIGPRGEVYERMRYQPDEPAYADYSSALEKALDPDQETPVEWQNHTRQRATDQSRTLPYQLTSDLLTRWLIPLECHHCFLGCETEDQLQNCGAPDTYILHVVDCLWPATAEELVDQPNLVVQQPGDLTRYAEGNLIDFLLLLDKDQERYVDWGLKGPTLVKGGPGSGKSTVAMYRVRALVERAVRNPRNHSRSVRVLFTTYTNTLVEVSRQLISHLLEGVQDSPIELEVSTVDRIARQIVESKDGKPTMASHMDLLNALTSARAAYNPHGKTLLESMLIGNALKALRDDYLIEEFEWVIEGQGIQTLEEYLKVDRSGRGYAFDARMREAVWMIYEHADRFLQYSSPRKTTWGTLRRRALELVMSGQWQSQKFDYVLVDEAQDLTPAALAFCIDLCQSPEGIFLTADASQSLYNKGFAWKNVHDSLRVTGRTRILKRNYRTTRQIATAAAAMLNNTGAGDEEALDQVFVHSGPRPVILSAVNEEMLFLALADRLAVVARELHMPNSAIAILAPNNQLAQQAAAYLTNFGLPTTYVTGKSINLYAPGAKALTIHSGKGLEFPIVVLPYTEKGQLPRDLPDERADDLEKHLAQERRILFVGMTRAMRRLIVAYRNRLISPFMTTASPDLWDCLDIN